VTFQRSTLHLAALHEILVQAAQPDVDPGRWQPNPMAEWCDAWSNVSSCLYMAEGRAAHEEQHESLETLRCFHVLLLRAMHWSKTQGTAVEQITLQCKISGGDAGRYQRYEQEVRGYHYDEFSASITDAGNLLAALQGTAGFQVEIRWLRQVIDELAATQQSMLHGLATPKAASPRVSAAWDDEWQLSASLVAEGREQQRLCPRESRVSCPRVSAARSMFRFFSLSVARGLL